MPTSSARGGQPLSLYKHEEQAVALAAEGASFVVTTGTASGKSLCFFIPIVSHVLAARRANAQRRTQAVVVYPMNALANSQMEELSKFWDPDRRFPTRCEIDAAFFHFYGISRDDTAYIPDTFPVIERSKRREHGEYRTKRVVLEIYDALAAAAARGQPYHSPLGPPRRVT